MGVQCVSPGHHHGYISLTIHAETDFTGQTKPLRYLLVNNYKYKRSCYMAGLRGRLSCPCPCTGNDAGIIPPSQCSDVTGPGTHVPAAHPTPSRDGGCEGCGTM